MGNAESRQSTGKETNTSTAIDIFEQQSCYNAWNKEAKENDVIHANGGDGCCLGEGEDQSGGDRNEGCDSFDMDDVRRGTMHGSGKRDDYEDKGKGAGNAEDKDESEDDANEEQCSNLGENYSNNHTGKENMEWGETNECNVEEQRRKKLGAYEEKEEGKRYGGNEGKERVDEKYGPDKGNGRSKEHIRNERKQRFYNNSRHGENKRDEKHGENTGEGKDKESRGNEEEKMSVKPGCSYWKEGSEVDSDNIGKECSEKCSGDERKAVTDKLGGNARNGECKRYSGNENIEDNARPGCSFWVDENKEHGYNKNSQLRSQTRLPSLLSTVYNLLFEDKESGGSNKDDRHDMKEENKDPDSKLFKVPDSRLFKRAKNNRIKQRNKLDNLAEGVARKTDGGVSLGAILDVSYKLTPTSYLEFCCFEGVEHVRFKEHCDTEGKKVVAPGEDEVDMHMEAEADYINKEKGKTKYEANNKRNEGMVVFEYDYGAEDDVDDEDDLDDDEDCSLFYEDYFDDDYNGGVKMHGDNEKKGGNRRQDINKGRDVVNNRTGNEGEEEDENIHDHITTF